MLMLVCGLVLFLAPHGVRLYADGWRSAMVARLGEGRWKGAYSVLSLVGLVLMAAGFHAARAAPLVLWMPPPWTRHLAALLVLVAFVLLAAAYLPGTRICAAVGHPMLAAVKAWALAHLLANGTLADVVLFGSFLAWATLDFMASRRRDRREGRRLPPGAPAGDLAAVAVGGVAWFLFARYGHLLLFGVSPLAG